MLKKNLRHLIWTVSETIFLKEKSHFIVSDWISQIWQVEQVYSRKQWAVESLWSNMFTFSHFADAFIQSDLQLGNT